MSRFDVGRFRPPPDPELLCGICMNVLDNPLETPCRHVFCSDCIKTALQEQSKCPLCRKRCKLYHLKDVLPLVQNMINKLTMTCSNCDNGCTELINVECYLEHQKSCEYVMVQCRNKNCGQQLWKIDQKGHETHTCAYRDHSCEGGCGLVISLADRDAHNCIEALLTLVRELKQKNSDFEQKVYELNSVISGLSRKLEENESQHNTNRSNQSWLCDSDSEEDDDYNDDTNLLSDSPESTHEGFEESNSLSGFSSSPRQSTSSPDYEEDPEPRDTSRAESEGQESSHQLENDDIDISDLQNDSHFYVCSDGRGAQVEALGETPDNISTVMNGTAVYGKRAHREESVTTEERRQKKRKVQLDITAETQVENRESAEGPSTSSPALTPEKESKAVAKKHPHGHKNGRSQSDAVGVSYSTSSSPPREGQGSSSDLNISRQTSVEERFSDLPSRRDKLGSGEALSNGDRTLEQNQQAQVPGSRPRRSARLSKQQLKNYTEKGEVDDSSDSTWSPPHE